MSEQEASPFQLREPSIPFAPVVEVLSQVRRPGDFYAGGTIVTPIPRIDVDGVGTVSFPLPPAQAQALMSVAQPAPYGRGAETIVDPEIRRTWQIAPSQFQIADLAWQRTLETIVSLAVTGLGVEGEVVAELYKMLIYDEGSFFLEHRDSEKTPGMFATLVVVLPSLFQGGELVVRHGEREVSLTLPGEALSEVSWAAFYADCRHELRPVVAGHRLSLIYNLVRKGNAVTAPDYGGALESLVTFLHQWAIALDSPTTTLPLKLIWVLEHHYTPAGLSFAGLKNADAAVGRLVIAAAKAAACSVRLAMVSIEESGIAEHNEDSRRARYQRDHDDDFTIIEVSERRQRLTDFVRPDDESEALGPLPFDKEELCQPDVLQGEEPDELHFMEATGNEGASFERTYRRSVLVLWPERHFFSVLAAAGNEVALPLLRQQANNWKASGQGEEAASWVQTQALARCVVNRWPVPDAAVSHFGRDAGVADMLAALTTLRDVDETMRFLSTVVAAGSYGEQANPAIVTACAVVGWPKASPLVTRIIETQAAASFAACAGLLDLATGVANPGDAASLRAAAAVLVNELPGDPTKVAHQEAWRRPPTPDAACVAHLLAALLRIGNGPLAELAAEHMLRWPATYDLDRVLIPAVRSCLKKFGSVVASDAGWARLRAACIAHLSARSALPLAPPSDQTRPAKVDCSCSDCASLAVFLDDPIQSRWALKAAERARSHVEQRIRQHRLDVDVSTETGGRPYSLLCIKNQKSYELRCAQREQDSSDLRQLIAFQ